MRDSDVEPLKLSGCPCGAEPPHRLYVPWICRCGRLHNPPEVHMPTLLERIDMLERRIEGLEAKNEEHKL